MNIQIQRFIISKINQMIEKSTDQVEIQKLQGEVKNIENKLVIQEEKRIEDLLALQKLGFFAPSRTFSQATINNKI